MQIVCLDLEGVLIPEVWLAVADATGIDDLKLTTRDIADYDQLMQHRLTQLERHRLGINDLQTVIADMTPLPDAGEFLERLRADYQVLILSDTFYEFAAPLIAQLGRPTLFCHRLQIEPDGRISGYRLRQNDQKKHAVRAFQQLNFRVIAAGDSYNDISMLTQAEAGILFCPSANIVAEFPQFPVCHDYPALRAAIDAAARRVA